MAKRNRQLTKSKIDRMIKEGRGQGTGKDYKPWILIQDVPSEGRATRGLGWTTGRRHELLSDIERDYCYLLDYSDEISDIREQFPLLPLEETQLIAEKIGVKHPTDPVTGEPIVMTTDFLITFNDKEIARTVKPFTKLEDERTIDKFEIERLYWEQRHVDWGIVTDNDLPDGLVRNIEWVHKEYHNEDVPELGMYAINNLKQILSKSIQDGEVISRACLSCDERLGVDVGTSLALFRHFIARKIWSINMDERILPTLPAKDFYVSSTIRMLEAQGG
ncbi:TnsA endonuclease N-terminal domain-containing protein [Paenibacillus frigoriresistens]|uniref:TnsA endonuclease N-terminal domain-containing protein n=1 Tax=Paenibacillus alginolyticus TaxID=59839 RepID=UPI001563E2B0|nr:TnsA endonuclease N-terminal domain-containing protein [Paenibacillus frigoriresistens]NRF95822.1 TnsA endonuclease N-terminal domain-containing protein [Paenibacillus frigoriresistens]